MKQLLNILLSATTTLLVLTSYSWSATYDSSVTVFSRISIVSESYVTFTWGPSVDLLAGPWDAGKTVATVAAAVSQGTATERVATRWSEVFYNQAEVPGSPELRDITSATGDSVRLKLSCDDATADASGKGWLTANSGSAMNCAITAGQTAEVKAGVYTISLEGSVYSP